MRWAAMILVIFALAAFVLMVPAIRLRTRRRWGSYHGGGGGGSGGGGFQFHGSGGSGGHGGSGDGGWIAFLLFELFVDHPVFGIALILGCGAVLLLLSAQGSIPIRSRAARLAFLHPGSPTPSASRRSLAFALMTPTSTRRPSTSAVGVAFRKIQDAWCAHNLNAIRPFISDGVHERFTLQFAEQRAQGWRDHMENIRITNITLAELRTDGLFDELSVRIDATAVDYRVSLVNGKRLSGSTAPERFVEIWSFLRHGGAVTQPGRAGLIEGNCPNCGAAVAMNQSTNCDHCKALLRSGQYDWVLAEITQEVEWQGQRHGAVPGVGTIRSRDPEFNAVELEDRASVIYWRKATADRLGKIDPRRKAAI